MRQPDLSGRGTHLLEVLEEIFPVPGGLPTAQLTPDVIVARRAPVEDLAVDGGAAADDAADADKELAVVELGVREGSDIVDRLAGAEPLSLCGCVSENPSVGLVQGGVTEISVLDGEDGVCYRCQWRRRLSLHARRSLTVSTLAQAVTNS